MAGDKAAEYEEILGYHRAVRNEIGGALSVFEAACFVVCATDWLDADQQAQIVKDTGGIVGPISSGCFTAIVAPDGSLLGEPIQRSRSRTRRESHVRR